MRNILLHAMMVEALFLGCGAGREILDGTRHGADRAKGARTGVVRAWGTLWCIIGRCTGRGKICSSRGGVIIGLRTRGRARGL